jgi:hypothetical protein
MKTLFLCLILTLTGCSCADKQVPNAEKQPVLETKQQTEKVFKRLVDFPKIQDTSRFVADLEIFSGFEADNTPTRQANGKITTYKKVKIYGSDKDYFFIECAYNAGSNASFPWKYQVLASTDGKLVKTLSGQRFEFVQIFKNENPFLLTVVGTAKGNGGHEIYKMVSDTLQNVYEGYFDYAIQTYDAHEDNWVYEPKELKLGVKDVKLRIL